MNRLQATTNNKLNVNYFVQKLIKFDLEWYLTLQVMLSLFFAESCCTSLKALLQLVVRAFEADFLVKK